MQQQEENGSPNIIMVRPASQLLSSRPHTPMMQQEHNDVATIEINEPNAEETKLQNRVIEKSVASPRKTSSGLIDCPFKYYGCHKRGEEKDVKLHLRDDRNLHVLLLCNCFLDIVRSYKELDRNFQKTDGMFTEMEASAETHGVLKLGPQFVFVIKDIGKVRDRARAKSNVLHSAVFESHRYGYQLSATLAPDGDGLEKRHFMGLFICIVRGEYDAVQEWPFLCPIRCAINNKNTEVCAQTITPTVEGNMPFLQRPVGIRNPCFGIKKFVAIDDVMNYAENGTLYISITVDIAQVDEKYSMTPYIPIH